EGYRTIADLQAADETTLARRFGNEGLRLWRLARGIDTRSVNPERETKSVSTETTFDSDIADYRTLEQELYRLTRKLSDRLKAADLAGRTVTLKLKTADFRLITRARSLEDPTRLAHRIFDHARELLARETDGRRFRLIGVGVSELADPALADPADLVDTSATKRSLAELATDSLRARFGKAIIDRGIALDAPKRREPEQPHRNRPDDEGTPDTPTSRSLPSAAPRRK
ncbi:MAG: DNA polymerase IV, partial [Starkeya sp.]|nr:DNA polymerase IV [Starkeya sp.]